jgi:hypothetical protein
MSIAKKSKMKLKTKTNTKIKSNTKIKIKRHKKTKNKLNNTKRKGGSFLNIIGNSVFKNNKKRNYSVKYPGSGLIKAFSSGSSNPQNKLISIIFNHHKPNEKAYDITNLTNNTLSSKFTTKEPYLRINNSDKYLIVIYREKNKKNIPEPIYLLHFLVGFINSLPTKIFHYIEPKIKPGRKQKFIVKIYKYPVTDKTKIFTTINNFNKKKAYQELSTYLNTVKLPVINTFVYYVQGEFGSSVNLFNMIKLTR